MNNQCFVCSEEKKNIDRWSIYSEQKQELNVCSECTDQLGELKYSVANWNKFPRISKCSLCEREIKIQAWNVSLEGVYLDIYRNYRYYRICKCCWDLEIELKINDGA